MKRDTNSEQKRPEYSGRMDVNTYYALEQLALKNRDLDNQRIAIIADKAGNAVKAVAGAVYEVGIKAPARGLYNLASLGVQAGVGLAGVVANTALGLIPAIAGAYAAVNSINNEKDPLEEEAQRTDEYVRNLTDLLKGSRGPIINV